MAGIYIHIPFCKTRCTYCDFYSQTDYSQQSDLVQAMLRELENRKTYLNEHVETIYFGGGTPSTLSISQIETLLKTIFSIFTVEVDAEVTLEANPDDLSLEYLTELRKAGVNRLSLGVQSFDDRQLKAINRRHTAATALISIDLAHQAGFENISIDLIFGLPGQAFDSWKHQVDKAMTLEVQHLSAYGLTYEEGTPIWLQMKSGKIIPTDDDTMIEMYNYLVSTCAKYGFEQYEISNFAKQGYRSHHNSSYWKQKPYLGIGPAAHSFDRNSRQWNVASVTQYCHRILNDQISFESEILSTKDKYNDFVMVSLRTLEGINLTLLEKEFGEYFHNYCLKSADKYIESNRLYLKDAFLRLTPDGIMISDQIISDLMHL